MMKVRLKPDTTYEFEGTDATHSSRDVRVSRRRHRDPDRPGPAAWSADGGTRRIVDDGERRGAPDPHRSGAGARQFHRLSSEPRRPSEGVDVELDDSGDPRAPVAAACRNLLDARAEPEPAH